MVAALRMSGQDHGTRDTGTGERFHGFDRYQRIQLLDGLSAKELKELEAVGTAILAENPEPDSASDDDGQIHDYTTVDPEGAALYLGDPAKRPDFDIDEDGDVIELMTYNTSNGGIQFMTAMDRDELEYLMDAIAVMPVAHSDDEIAGIFGCGTRKYERSYGVVHRPECTNHGPGLIFR